MLSSNTRCDGFHSRLSRCFSYVCVAVRNDEHINIQPSKVFKEKRPCGNCRIYKEDWSDELRCRIEDLTSCSDTKAFASRFGDSSADQQRSTSRQRETEFRLTHLNRVRRFDHCILLIKHLVFFYRKIQTCIEII